MPHKVHIPPSNMMKISTNKCPKSYHFQRQSCTNIQYHADFHFSTLRTEKTDNRIGTIPACSPTDPGFPGRPQDDILLEIIG